MKRNIWFNLSLVLVFLALAGYVFYLYRQGVLASTQAFEAYLAEFGAWEAIIFIGIQIVQVVFPFMPSSLGCVVGMVLFGPILGFAYNYLAICTGSCVNFLLSKRYGTSLVRKMVGQARLDKYMKVINDQDRFRKLFTTAIFVPGAPDDYLCYLAGLTPMTFRRFIAVILLGKPLSIAIFSVGTAAAMHFVVSLLNM